MRRAVNILAHFTSEGFMTVMIPKVVCLIMTLCSLVGGNHLFGEHTISIFRAEDGGMFLLLYQGTQCLNPAGHNTNVATCL